MYSLRKHLLLVTVFLALIISACSPKPEKYKETEKEFCQNNRVENEFIAHWSDSNPTLVITEDVESFISKHRHEIDFIEPNYTLRLHRQVRTVRLNTTLSAYKILNEIGALRAWRKGYQGQNILVAVVDSGIDVTNSKIRGNIFSNTLDSNQDQYDDDQNGYIDDANGWNFTSNSNQIVDEIGHGTSIAGIISGSEMEGESLGIAPEARILPIDIMSGGTGSEFNVKRALDYAIQMRANIINNSWSITCSYYLSSAFEQYEKENVIFVNSAGNEPIDVLKNRVMLASLALANFLNVGSTSLFGDLSEFSGYGKTINMWAPGEQVPVLTLDDNEGTLTKASGTSVSAAIVSGSAALVWSAHPEESALQIISRLKKGAVKIKGRSFIAIDRALR